MPARDDLLIPTADGLYCPEGGFHVDPWKPVDRAVVTHAHSDHAGFGSRTYLCSARGERVLRMRVGESASIQGLPYGKSVTLNGVRVSLYPAGHILGSAQIRIERIRDGHIWVVSGDYKTEPDRTCDAMEPVPCHVFITESTFGLPIYRWQPSASIFDEINAWWRDNQAQQRTSVILAYALGKAQRVLGGVDASIGPIVAHGAVARFDAAYAAAGIALPTTLASTGKEADTARGVGLVIAPPSALGSPWMRRFTSGPATGGLSAAMVSGWMQVRGTRRRRAVDRGFVLSDHADWPGLLSTIRATGAERVGVTHGYIRPLVRWLTESGLEAFEVPTRYQGETGEDAEAAAAAEAPEGDPSEGAA